jgi:hypothetical protein
MKQASEYRQHAGECLKLALSARSDQERQQLKQMAEAWERMALERERQIANDANMSSAARDPVLIGQRARV